jgi:pseudaminic acid synthase
MNDLYIEINGRKIGPNSRTYIVAELSANHHQNLDEALRLIREAKKVGADAIKLQTYTPDTLTIDADTPPFRIGGGTIWDDRTLYELYQEAYTPWDWHPQLKALANDLGLDLFSTPFDSTAVDFLEQMDVPAFKIASFEVVALPLIRRVARTGKPIIMSTGMATLAEIDEAVQTARKAGATQIALLKCSSAYPSLPEEMNLRTIPHMAQAFGLPVGLSDHTLGIAVAIAAVALGACVVEKHFTLSRAVQGPDSAFSLEPQEFRTMVEAIRVAEKALGAVSYDVTEREAASRALRPSLFIVQDLQAGDVLTEENLRSIRPGHGLHTRYLDQVLGLRVMHDISRGTPLRWGHVAGPRKEQG